MHHSSHPWAAVDFVGIHVAGRDPIQIAQSHRPRDVTLDTTPTSCKSVSVVSSVERFQRRFAIAMPHLATPKSHEQKRLSYIRRYAPPRALANSRFLRRA